MSGPDATKQSLRQRARSMRDALDPAWRREASDAACRRAIAFLQLRPPTCVSTYLAIGSELDPAPLRVWIEEEGLEGALPAVVDRTTMTFRRHRSGDALIDESFGTRAPTPGAPTVRPDTIIVPLLAFDREGGRLGYGAGHYDRTVAAMRAAGAAPFLLGLAFSRQEVASVPRQPHDIALDAVATDVEVILVSDPARSWGAA